MREFVDRRLEPLGAGQAGAHDHVSLLPVGDPVGLAESVSVGDLETESGSRDQFTDPIPVRRQIPLDQCGRHFGEWLAVGLGEIEDVDDSEADNPAFFIFTVPGVILRVTGARICRPRSFVRTEHLATGSRPGRSAPADTSQPGSPSLPAALTTRSSIPTSWWETGYSGNSRDHHSRRRETKDRRHSLSRPRENDLHAAGVEGRKDRRKEH